MSEQAADLTRTWPASPDELEVWLASERDPESAAYHIPVALHRHGVIDHMRLRHSLAGLQSRHGMLRSRFVQTPDSLSRQEYNAPAIPLLRQERARQFDLQDARAWAKAFSEVRFHLDDGPLMRVGILQYTDRSLVVMVIHHVIADAWSLDAVMTEILGCYDDDAYEPPTLREGPAEPRDDTSGEADATYWQSLIGQEPASLAPPTSFVVTDEAVISSFHAARIETSVLDGLRTNVQLSPASTAIIAFSVWAAILHLWSGEDEGLSGITFAGRLEPDSYPALGLRSRVLPVATAVPADLLLATFVDRNRRQIINSLMHSDVGADVVRKSLRSAGVTGLDAAFTYLRSTASEIIGTGGWESFDVPVAAAKTPIGLSITERPSGAELQLDYDTTRYDADSMRVLFDQYVEALRKLSRISDLSNTSIRDLLDFHDRPLLRERALDQDSFLPPRRSPVDIVRHHAELAGGAPAVRHGNLTVSYSELMSDVDSVAHGLVDEGVGRGELVGIMLPRGSDATAAILGAVAAGGAYLPLDPEFPASQLAAIAADAGLKIVVTSEDRLTDSLGVALVSVEQLRTKGVKCSGRSDHEGLTSSRDLFHCIYTSGSTGKPKGVMLDRRGFMRLLGTPGFVPLGPGDTMAHLSPLNFDASTFEIWASLTQGACLGVMEKRQLLDPHTMAQAIRELDISAAIMTSPLFNHLVDAEPQSLSTLNWIYIGGEAVSPDHVRRSLQYVGPGVLFHSYGPAENSFTTHCRAVSAVDANQRTIALGTEVPYTHSYVVYEGTIRLTPIGVPGELLVGGPGLSWGYLGEPRLTSKKFIPDAFSGVAGARLYRSGDRVRWNADGEIEFIGRIDGQVKIRGNRVELSGVEAALRAVDSVATACALVIDDAARGKELVAFIVPRTSGAKEDARRYVLKHLPQFAQPRRYIEIPAIPRKENNKVDQNVLRRLAGVPAESTVGSSARARLSNGAQESVPRDAAESDIQGTVGEVWQRLLGHDDVQDRNFFDAGGDSLMLFRLSEALRQSTGANVTVVELLQYATVDSQARRIGELLDRSPREAPQSAIEGSVSLGRTRSRRADEDESVAIVGMGCSLAGASDLWKFSNALVEGTDVLSGSGSQSPSSNGRVVVDKWGTLAAYHADLAEYALSPDETNSLDPQHAVFMADVVAAIQDAGYSVSDIAERTSIFAGAARRSAMVPRAESSGQAFVAALADSNAFLATRVAYGLGLRGEAVMMDTACSTSLVAVHAARASLLSGSSDYALAGGVSIQSSDTLGYVYEPGLIYSPTGECRPFDERANGTVGGDGSGVVLLKRLSDAVRDGDPIYAIIRGSAVNNDGRDKVGYTAPNQRAQFEVIRSSLASAEIDAIEVSYIEAHGTGTLLGDRIEAEALVEVFGGQRNCHVGSVKATVGHLNTAAGIAGLIKAALAIHNRIIPATPGVENGISGLSGPSGRLLMSPETIPWDSSRLVAGVSSFGIGGTNAHVTLTES